MKPTKSYEKPTRPLPLKMRGLYRRGKIFWYSKMVEGNCPMRSPLPARVHSGSSAGQAYEDFSTASDVELTRLMEVAGQ